MCANERDREIETEREEKESIIFNNLILYGYSVSLNEPIPCHCVRDFKEYLMNVGFCSSRYIKTVSAY